MLVGWSEWRLIRHLLHRIDEHHRCHRCSVFSQIRAFSWPISFFVVPEWLVNNTAIFLFCKYVPRTRILRWRWRGLMNSSYQNTTLPNAYADCEAPSEAHTSQHRNWSRNMGETLCCKVSSNHEWRCFTYRISSEASFIFPVTIILMYTPTKEELEEMWFENNDEFSSIYLRQCWEKFSSQITYSFVTTYFYIGNAFIYPQSKQDIEALIRLLSKPE